MIDNQQVKYKIIIPFSASRSFAVPVSYPLLEGGGGAKKRQPGRPDFGEVVRPAYPPLHIPSYLTTCPAYPYMPVVPTYPHSPSNPIPHPLTT